MKSLIILSLILVGCAKTNAPLLQAPPEKYQELFISAGETIQIKEPEVDILFVIDNSGSMKDHQATLIKNMDKFADAFLSSNRLDYRIGIVPVYDSKYLNDRMKNRFGVERKMNPLGELVALKDKDGNLLDSVPYVTRDTPNAKEVLKATANIGIQWGPEAEEHFSPVLSIISDENKNINQNGGFYRKNAHLVVIFLTDADDATQGYTAEEFYNDLVQAKTNEQSNGSEKVHLAAGLADPSKKSKSCAIDGSGPVYKMRDLLSFATYANLCSEDFGSTFAEFATRVAEKISIQRIKLNFNPDVNFELYYGIPGQDISEKQKLLKEGKGSYLFTPSTNEIILPADLKFNKVKDGQLFLEATPIELRNLNNGRLNTL